MPTQVSLIRAWNVLLGKEENINSIDNALVVQDYWIQHAIETIFTDTGDLVSVDEKRKDLLKFGRNELTGTSLTTIQHQPAGILHETYVTSNLINSVISTSVADTQDIIVEGHTTADGGLTFTFVEQPLTLNGQTSVALTTPLARVVKGYNDNSTELAGVISFTETDTYTAGVPDTDTKVHMQINAGQQVSEKCATTISSEDYWIVTSIYGDMLKKAAGFAEVDFQVRKSGKVFSTHIDISCSDGARGEHEFKPYFIVPKNSDVRLSALASAASTDVAGGIQGVLAKVVG